MHTVSSNAYSQIFRRTFISYQKPDFNLMTSHLINLHLKSHKTVLHILLPLSSKFFPFWEASTFCEVHCRRNCLFQMEPELITWKFFSSTTGKIQWGWMVCDLIGKYRRVLGRTRTMQQKLTLWR